MAGYCRPHLPENSPKHSFPVASKGHGVDRAQLTGHFVPVLPGGIAEGVADQMDDAGMDHGEVVLIASGRPWSPSQTSSTPRFLMSVSAGTRNFKHFAAGTGLQPRECRVRR